jgi:L-threonylcarbamoyladenylate synthase
MLTRFRQMAASCTRSESNVDVGALDQTFKAVETVVVNVQDALAKLSGSKSDRHAALESKLAAPASYLSSGELVAFPTETVYGLGANALDASAVMGIFKAKGRPADNPLIVHIASFEQLASIAYFEADSDFGVDKSGYTHARKLIEAFWPGPLTLLFRRRACVPDVVTAGLDSVAVRWPSHPVAECLIALANVPVAAPSANVSGRPSPTCAAHVLADLRGRVRCVVDGGAARVGVESTVVDVRGGRAPIVLRPGGVTLEMLRQVVPDATLYDVQRDADGFLGGTAAPPTPGLKYRHYSPSAPVMLFTFDDGDGRGDAASSGADANAQRDAILTHIDRWRDANSSSGSDDAPIGLIRTQSRIVYTGDMLRSRNIVLVDDIGNEASPERIAANIFGALRSLDARGVSLIIVEGIDVRNEGLAVMNRLAKAASQTIAL